MYVGPHEPPTSGEFWNAPFGAYRTWDDVRDAAAALAFLRSGHDAATRQAMISARAPGPLWQRQDLSAA